MAGTVAVMAVILFTMAGISAALAAALWFLLGIPAVVRDLTGNRGISRGKRGQVQRRRTGKAKGKAVPVEITMVEEIVCVHTEEEL